MNLRDAGSSAWMVAGAIWACNALFSAFLMNRAGIGLAFAAIAATCLLISAVPPERGKLQ